MNVSVTNDPALVDQILQELEPLVARQRRAVAHDGCLRNVSSTHLHVLLLVIGEGTMTMSRLAEHLDVSLPSMTGIIERMVERGLVERTRPDDDRRLVAVGATELGRQTAGEIDMVRRSQMARLLERLTLDEQQRALRTFRALRRAAESLDSEETREMHA